MPAFPIAARALVLLAAALTAGACATTPDGPVAEAGELASGDLTLTRGEFYDRYTVAMDAGDWIKVDLRSDAFDPYLVLRTPSGAQSDIDDSTPGDTTHTELIHHATERGTFEVLVTSFAAGETGAYTLTYAVTAAEPAAAGETRTVKGEPDTPADAGAAPHELPPGHPPVGGEAEDAGPGVRI